MMKEILDLNLGEYITMTATAEAFGHELIIREIESVSRNDEADLFPIRVDAYSIVLVRKGEAFIELDCQSYRLTGNSVMEMGIGNLVENVSFSPGFRGYLLLIGQNLMKEVLHPLTGLFPGNTVKLKYLYPTRILDTKEADNLLEIIRRIQKYIADKEHFYRGQMIKNELGILIMELNYTLWKRYSDKGEEVTGYRTIKERFRELLHRYVREQHEVAFYANQLCLTPDHLSKVMRNCSGRSAGKWIDQTLTTEAKILLRKPDISVQKVSDLLHFSDQSAFGKFFKKQTGQSPMEYKKGR